MNIESIYVYPIKSVRGLSLKSATLDDHGFQYDRNFTLLKVLGEGDVGYGSGRLDAKRTEYMSIADIPWMCLFEVTEIGEETFRVEFHTPSSTESETIDIPLRPDLDGLDRVGTVMWQSELGGYAMRKDYNDWFSERFGFEVVLVYIGPGFREIIGNIVPDAVERNPERRRQWDLQHSSWASKLANPAGLAKSWMSGKAQDDYLITFVDYAPLLVVSTKSCDEVSNRLGQDEDMDIRKFRPNIVVRGAKNAFEEDYWAELVIGGDKRILLTANCVRCTSLNVDFNTGKIGTGESGKVLKKLQADRRVDKGVKFSPVFGRYGFLTRDGPTSVELRVSESVEVSRKGEERTTFKWPGFGSTAKDDYYPV